MSKGFEPLSGLVVYVYLGAARGTTLLAEGLPRCAARWEQAVRSEKAAPRRRGKFPSLFSTTSLGEAGTNSAARFAPHDGSLDGGALGGFERRRRGRFPRRFLEKPVFGAYFFGTSTNFEIKSAA